MRSFLISRFGVSQKEFAGIVHSHQRVRGIAVALSQSLDLRSLEALVVLVNEGSVTRAAERMGISQPRMSNMLARLRLQFGDPLLVRSGQRLMPTVRAHEIAAAVRTSLASLSEVLAHPQNFEPENSDRSFILAMSDYVSVLLLPPLLAAMARDAPNVTILVKMIEPTLIEQWLDEGEAHIAFGLLTHLNERLRASVLLHDDAVCIARAGHPQIDGAIALDQFSRLRHVVTGGTPTPTSTLEQVVDRILGDSGLVRHVAMRTISGLALAETVATTDLVATLPRSAAKRYADGLPLQIVDLPFRTVGFDVTMVWHERLHREPAFAWLRQAVRAALRSERLAR